MFVGRATELAELKRSGDARGFQLVVVSGLRRVGKTALVRRFLDDLRDVPTIYFCASPATARNNLGALGRQIVRAEERRAGRTAQLGDAEYDPTFPFSSFRDAFGAIAELASTQRVVFVIDELPDLLESSKDIGSLLSEMVGEEFAQSQLMLIVCGSHLPTMRQLTGKRGGVFYGRDALCIDLAPLGFSESARFIKENSVGRAPTPEVLARYYGCLGGVPFRLAQIDPRRSFVNNIKSLFLDATSPLFDEPGDQLRRELREPATYRAVLEALATGSTRLSEVAAYTGMETGNCSLFLKNLIGLGLVVKEEPVIREGPYRTEYRIVDPLFLFWFRFVSCNLSLIGEGRGEEVYLQISPQIDLYMEKAFRDICMHWLKTHRDRMPIAFTHVGRWWGVDAFTHKDAAVDIVAFEGDKTATADAKLLCANCIWNADPLDPEAVDELVSCSETFGQAEKHYLLFSRGGFTSACRIRAREQGDVRLVALDEML